MYLKLREYFGKIYLRLLRILAVLGIIDVNGVIIFSSPLFQNIIALIICLLILSLFIASFFIKKIIFKISSIIIFGIMCPFSLLFICFIIGDIDSILKNGGVDYGFECINEIKLSNESIKEYRTNGGATTGYGIVIRTEKKIFPGIIFVNTLFEKDEMDTAIININKDTLFINDEYNQFAKKIILK